MTKSQELTVKLSELREKGSTTFSASRPERPNRDTELRELTAQIQKTEPELRAAIAAEPDPEVRTTATGDSETRERNALARDARVGEFIARAVHRTPLEGREAEVADAFGCPGMLPLALFDVDRAAGDRDVTLSRPV